VKRNVNALALGGHDRPLQGLVVSNAEQNFHRVRGYRHLPILVRAQRHDAAKIDQTEEAA
jgi:hypothetical protein